MRISASWIVQLPLRYSLIKEEEEEGAVAPPWMRGRWWWWGWWLGKIGGGGNGVVEGSDIWHEIVERDMVSELMSEIVCVLIFIYGLYYMGLWGCYWSGTWEVRSEIWFVEWFLGCCLCFCLCVGFVYCWKENWELYGERSSRWMIYSIGYGRVPRAKCSESETQLQCTWLDCLIGGVPFATVERDHLWSVFVLGVYNFWMKRKWKSWYYARTKENWDDCYSRIKEFDSENKLYLHNFVLTKHLHIIHVRA